MLQHEQDDTTMNGTQGVPVKLRDRILGFVDIQSELMEIPEWGGVTVEIRGMSGKARNRFIKQITGDNPEGEVDIDVLYPMLVILTVHDPDTGERLFDERDIEALNSRSSMVLERIAEVANRLSGLDKGTERKAGKP